MSDHSDLPVYIFQGKAKEEVPPTVEKLIVHERVEELPDKTCFKCELLREVALPNALTGIGKVAFYECQNLSEIVIGNTVQVIGYAAFQFCERLRKLTLNIQQLAHIS